MSLLGKPPFHGGSGKGAGDVPSIESYRRHWPAIKRGILILIAQGESQDHKWFPP